MSRKSTATLPAEGMGVRLSRRQFLRWVAGAGAAGVLAACVPGRPAPPVTTKPISAQQVQLVYQDWRTDWFPPMAREMLNQFHETHPNIRVFYTLDPENLAEKMTMDLQAGTAADVFDGCCDFFPVWGQQNYTIDLRPFVERDLTKTTLDDWDPAQYRALFTRDGRQFGLPKYHGALALYYNKDMFDHYDVAYPVASWNHDDYLAAMKKLVQRANPTGQPAVYGSMFDISWERIQVHVNEWGGHFVDPNDPAHCLMDERTALEAMEWLRTRIWKDGVMASFLDVQNMGTRESFVAGKVVMVEDGSWALKDMLSAATFRIGVVPFPAGPIRRATLATTDGFAIYRHSKYPEAAWELMKFLISPEYGRAMAKAHLLQPARASLVDEWVTYIQAQYPNKAKEMDLEAFADGHIKGYSVIAETFANQAAASSLANAAWQEIFTLGKAPVSSMAEVSKQIEAAQKEGA